MAHNTDHITAEDLDRAVEDGYPFTLITREEYAALLIASVKMTQAIYDDNKIKDD